MSPREAHLPDFLEPPVIETVLGVSFAPLAAWRIPHYGLFWEKIKNEYPRIDVQPPIALQTEKFGLEERMQPQPSIELMTEPAVRCWFLDSSGETIVQLQRDGFLQNWKRNNSNQPYPHYSFTRPIFERGWRNFVNFLGTAQIGLPNVLQCEVTYVNHIERGTMWNEFKDIPSVFGVWSGVRAGLFLPQPEGVGFSIRFQMPEQKGRLHVLMQPGIRQSDGKDVLELKLTARGKPASSDLQDILGWLDLGREWIVRGFADLTSEKAHKFWKRTQ